LNQVPALITAAHLPDSVLGRPVQLRRGADGRLHLPGGCLAATSGYTVRVSLAELGTGQHRWCTTCRLGSSAPVLSDAVALGRLSQTVADAEHLDLRTGCVQGQAEAAALLTEMVRLRDWLTALPLNQVPTLIFSLGCAAVVVQLRRRSAEAVARIESFWASPDGLRLVCAAAGADPDDEQVLCTYPQVPYGSVQPQHRMLQPRLYAGRIAVRTSDAVALLALPRRVLEPIQSEVYVVTGGALRVTDTPQILDTALHLYDPYDTTSAYHELSTAVAAARLV
jgi:hypothetical protein